MAVLQHTSPALDQRTTDHLRPLDAVTKALEESPCQWCQSILKLLRSHLHEYVPVFEEVRNS